MKTWAHTSHTTRIYMWWEWIKYVTYSFHQLNVIIYMHTSVREEEKKLSLEYIILNSITRFLWCLGFSGIPKNTQINDVGSEWCEKLGYHVITLSFRLFTSDYNTKLERGNIWWEESARNRHIPLKTMKRLKMSDLWRQIGRNGDPSDRLTWNSCIK